MGTRLFGTGFLPVSANDACKFLAYSSSDITLTTITTGSTITFDTAAIDTAGAHSATAYNFTCPSEGHYLVHVQLEVNQAVTIRLYKTGTLVAQTSVKDGTDNTVQLTHMALASAGDTFQVMGMNHDGGGSDATIKAKAKCSRFMVLKLA